MKKISSIYIISILICILSFGSIFFLCDRITIIQYLFLSITPIILNVLLYSIYIYINKSDNIMKESILLSGIYTFFIIFSIIIFNLLDVYKKISNNSKNFFMNGFSISSQINFSITDSILPAVLCFLFIYVFAIIMKNIRRNK